MSNPVSRLLSRMLGAAAITIALVMAAQVTPVIDATLETRSPDSAAAGSGAPSLVLRAAARRYTPTQGVRTNDPRTAPRVILGHILKSIRSVRHGESIRIISWNVNSGAFVDSLLDANRRGVSVRLIMSKGKADEQPPSGSYWRLKRGLRNVSKTHPQTRGQRSWARACDRSCRGRRGIAHSKSFVFSRVGNASRVVMSTSANATEVSADSQWNDMYTLVGNRKVYAGFLRIFEESARDRPVTPGYRTVTGGSAMAYFYPWQGRAARGDRVLRELRRINCKGARGGTGVNGRTRIRIAQDAIIGERGMRIGERLRRLHEEGCDIRIVYALMGKQVRQIVTHTNRGSVPIRQIVQDFNRDGVYDRYLHAKVMTVSGRYRSDRSARVAWQGSENWSGLAKISDEQGLRIRRPGAEIVYTRWVNRLFNNPPPSSRAVVANARRMGIDPYAIIKENLG